MIFRHLHKEEHVGACETKDTKTSDIFVECWVTFVRNSCLVNVGLLTYMTGKVQFRLQIVKLLLEKNTSLTQCASAARFLLPTQGCSGSFTGHRSCRAECRCPLLERGLQGRAIGEVALFSSCSHVGLAVHQRHPSLPVGTFDSPVFIPKPPTNSRSTVGGRGTSRSDSGRWRCISGIPQLKKDVICKKCTSLWSPVPPVVMAAALAVWQVTLYPVCLDSASV